MTGARRGGPSGANVRSGVLLRESRDGQIAEWTEAAARAGLTLSAWAREALDMRARAPRLTTRTPTP